MISTEPFLIYIGMAYDSDMYRGRERVDIEKTRWRIRETYGETLEEL